MYDAPRHPVTRYIPGAMLQLTRRLLTPLALVSLACHTGHEPPPPTNFLLVAGDSTFWVRTEGGALRVRGSPIQLANYGGRFYEVYVADDDHSYTDAGIVGQQVFRRDLITGDSARVFIDTLMTGLARWYARGHPEDRPLGADEDPADDPRVDASSDLSVIDQHGPYLSYEYRGDATIRGEDEWHVARRGVIDLRAGKPATVADLFGERNAEYVLHKGVALFSQALDSVRSSHDARARAAANAIGDFHFDSGSFSVLQVEGEPAVQFAATGRGRTAGGLLLKLSPIRVHPPAWWSEVQATLPAPDTDTASDQWPHGKQRVVATYPPSDDIVRLTLVDSAGRSWPTATVPSPARRIFWLDIPAIDSATLRGLTKAFDDAALYSEEVRTAMNDQPPDRGAPSRSRAARPVRDSQHETSEIMMPQHANNNGSVFGGVILSMMDRTAAVSAIRHCRTNVVTVSVDRVDFKRPIHLGDLVVMKSSVNYAGRTSMEVGIRVEAENLLTGVRRHTNSCYVTFVAVDRDGHPLEVPAALPETEIEQRRFVAAQERRRVRLEERTLEEEE